jgi:transcriptional regulator GlxA family with amidase domain
MKHVTILVPEGNGNLSSVIGPYIILVRANEHWKNKTGQTLLDIELAGRSANIEFNNGLFYAKPHTTIDAIGKTDLIIIPALNRNFLKSLKQNQPLISWIQYQYRQGAEVASICTGAFLLASTGLLEGMNCSTHWAAAEEFRNMFPGVKLQGGKLITDERGIYTNGGAFSFLNLMLYLVEKYFDRATAIFCSKVFQIEIDRGSQSVFTIFEGQKEHHDEMIREAQDFIENKINDKISIEELASRFAVSRRNFDRRFIKATGDTPVEYLQKVKMEAAKKAFENTRKTINEVMYEVGYNDTKAFREIFRRITGLSPLDYRKKYNREFALAYK